MLEDNGHELRYASSARNKGVRLIEMILMTVRNSRWADVVLIDTYSTSNFWYAAIVSQICRILSVRYAPILHGGNLPVRLKSNPWLSKMIFKNAAFCVAPSPYLANAFETAGYSVCHIPNPVDVTAFKSLKRVSVSAKLIWVRSLTELYNPKMALQVMVILKDDFPDVSLKMVGPDRGMLSELQEFAQANELDVTFTGKLTKVEWAKLADSCDVFLNTSTVDNAPFSILEALALGLFVVSTDVGGIPFLIKHEHHGLLVRSGDIHAMAQSIRRLIADSNLRKTIVCEASKLISDSSSVEVVKKWNEILR